MKTVSVIIPNYNNAQYLERAIQSVLSQTFTDYEIIVIDDGSTDSSREVVSTFGNKVRYIFQENKGLGGARNTGILASDAEFIGLLDADDEWLPSYLEKMIDLTDQYPSGDIFFCGARGVDSQGNDLPQFFGTLRRFPRYVPRNELYQKLLRANFLIPSTFLIRRSLFNDVGLFEQNNKDMHGCEDWDLWLRAIPSHDFVSTPDPLVRYRIHTTALSANPAKMQNAAKAVMKVRFGSDDGDTTAWSADKRRAYGGIYRYYLLTSVQRQNNWQNGSLYLRKALEVDPTLADDLDMFYELALGNQPNGYRGTTEQLDLIQNASNIEKMLSDVFSKPLTANLSSLQRTVYGTANYAIGLVAYNTNNKKSSRRFFLKTLLFIPKLWFDRRVSGNLIKSFISQPSIDKIKKAVFNLYSKDSNSIHKRPI